MLAGMARRQVFLFRFETCTFIDRNTRKRLGFLLESLYTDFPFAAFPKIAKASIDDLLP
jgi:hypothetical protein